MNNNSGSAGNSSKASRWLTFFFLFGILFVAQSNIPYLIGSQELSFPSAEEISIAIKHGSWDRRVAMLLLGLFCLILLLRKGIDGLRPKSASGWLIIFFWFWAVLSIAWTEDVFFTTRKLALLTIILLAAIALAHRFSLRETALFLFLSCSLTLLIGVGAELVRGSFHPLQTSYVFVGEMYPNAQGWNCATLLIVTMPLLRTAERGRKLYLAVASTALLFLIFTKSRTSFGGTLLSLGAYWTLVSLGPVSPRSLKVSCILGILFLLGLLYFIFGDDFFAYWKRLVLLGRGDASLYTLTGRIPLWKECLTYLSQRPLSGYGYDSFWTAGRVTQFSATQGWDVGVPDSHNTYLELALGVGIPGSFIYMLLQFLSLKKYVSLYKASHEEYYAFGFAMLVFYSSTMFFGAHAFHPSVPLFVSIVLLAKSGFVHQVK